MAITVGTKRGTGNGYLASIGLALGATLLLKVGMMAIFSAVGLLLL